MPPSILFDLSSIDLNHILFDKHAVREVNPQRYEFEMIDGVIWVDKTAERLLAFKDCHADEFWVRGHIPGRPLFPGVLMIEAAAQASCFYTRKIMGWEGFIGFGGVEDCKFRQQVLPGQRLHLLVQKIWERHKRVGSKVQGLVGGQLAFETTIIGVQF